ncbi:hypothetical protein GCM10027589_08610 [Actinocorallia lasiicapitis]
MLGSTQAAQREWLESAPAGPLRFTFPGRLEQVRAARKTVEGLFKGTGREDDAGLIVNELANNSCLYTRSGRPGGWFGVQVIFGGLAYIGVTDLGGAGWLIGGRTRTGSAAAPSETDPEDFDVPGLEDLRIGGRGLAIIAELAVSTGACGSDTLGHHVWATIDLPPHAVRRLSTAI